MRTRFRHVARAVALWVLVLPFALVSLIGTGMMPVITDSGSITLVICTGDGMVEVAVDPVTMEPVADRQRGGDAPDPGTCEWAAGQSAFTLAPTAGLVQAAGLTAFRHPPAYDTVRIAAAATGLPPATGPPAAL